MDTFHNICDTARNNLMTESDIDSLTLSEWKEFETLEELDSFTPVGQECVAIIRAAKPLLALVHDPLARIAIIRAVILEMVVKYNG